MKEKDAKLLLKGMIVEEEQIVRKLGMGILKGEISKNVRNLVVRVYFVLGANGFGVPLVLGITAYVPSSNW